MNRRRLLAGVAIGIVATALGWALMSGLSRLLRKTEPAPLTDAATQQTTPANAPAIPKIKATLFFASENGSGLTAVEQDIPLAEGNVAQARALVEAQLTAMPPAPLVSTIPEGTKLRGLYVSEKNEAFVDLDATVRDKHPGGSMNELFTVYTIVNAITANLPDVQQVQLLIDGREVDTLSGHVDLRRPLRKNESLITP
ncbi:MAG TPA: GerMN domain-containing protein [Vicinamibacterales bacterium]|nr:GerMN domain-containing protein [Vicinamibacterales bacterium]